MAAVRRADTNPEITLQKTGAKPASLRTKLLISAACALPMMMATAHAQDVTISDTRTAGVETATADGGNPANVTVDSNGTIDLTSGTALTQNSDNNLTHDGIITIEASDDSVGVLITGDVTGDYSQAGDITLERTQAQEDADDGAAIPDYNDNRFGVLLDAGSSLTGNLTISDTAGFTIFGDDSAALSLQGDVTGDVSFAGDVDIDGENAIGIDVSGDIDGDFTVGDLSSMSVQGVGAQGIVIDGNISGAASINGDITITGYRDTTRDSDDAEDNDNDTQAALQSGNAISVTGDIEAGLLINGPLPADEQPEDDPVAAIASINVIGGAHALFIDGSTIGEFDTSAQSAGYGDFGVINRGTLTGNGVYDGVAAEVVRIQNSTIAGGVRNDGTVSATALEADATAIAFGTGASTGIFYNDGTIATTSSGGAASQSIGVLIEAGADIASITNDGIIVATNINDTEDAVGIRDLSGSVTSVTNSGLIQGRVFDFNDGDDETTSDEGDPTGTTIAMDFSANTLGVSITNTVGPAFESSDNRAGVGLVRGNVLTGSGDDTYFADAGSTVGDIFLAAGNDTVQLEQNALITGNIDFGEGNDSLLLDDATVNGDLAFGAGMDVFSLDNGAEFEGGLTNSGDLALTIAGGSSLDITSNAAIDIASLDIDATSSLGLTVTDASNFTQLNASGVVNIADGASINPRLAAGFIENVDLSGGAFTATVINAGTLNANVDNIVLGDENGNTPFLFDFDLIESGGNAIDLSVALKGSDELGIAAALQPAIAPTVQALDRDPALGDFVFNLTSGDDFRAAFGQLLSGPLDAPLAYARAQNNSVTSIITQRLDLARNTGEFGRTFWLQEENYFVNRDEDATSNGFDGGGWSLALGVDTGVGDFLDAIGLSASVSSAKYDEQTGEDFPFSRTTYGVGTYAATSIGNLQIDGRVGYAWANSDSERNVVLGTERRVIEGEWDGTQTAASARVSYETEVSSYTVEPFVSFDFLSITEDAYQETGGSDDAGVKLNVEEREADSLRTNVGVKVGKVFELRPSAYDTGIPGTLHPQFSLAWSHELEDDPIETTYQYQSGGDAFTLASEPEDGAAILGADIAYENEYAKVHVGGSATVGDTTDVFVLRVGVGLKW